GPEALESLPQKRKKTKSTKTPKATKATPPTEPTEESKQSHPVSSGTVPDPQELERKNKSLGTQYDPKDSGETFNLLIRDSTVSNKGTAKTTPRLKNPLGYKDSEGNIPPVDIEPITYSVADLLGSSFEYQLGTKPPTFKTFTEIQTFLMSDEVIAEEEEVEEILGVGDEMDVDPEVLFSRIIKEQYDQHVEVAVSYDDLRAYVKVQEAVKDDPALNRKVIEATKAYTKHFATLTELLQLVKGFDFFGLKSIVESVKTVVKDQDKHFIGWEKSYANMVWNMGSSRSATLTLALTYILANVEGENEANTATEDPPSQTKGRLMLRKMKTSKKSLRNLNNLLILTLSLLVPLYLNLLKHLSPKLNQSPSLHPQYPKEKGKGLQLRNNLILKQSLSKPHQSKENILMHLSMFLT
ncbi:hypothetical protein Tco_0847831, partial [Tanacetum coccineum]